MSKTNPNVVLQWLLPAVVVSVGTGYGLFYYFPNLEERSVLSRREIEGNNAELLNDVVLTNLKTDQKRLLQLDQSLIDAKDLELTEEQVMKLPGRLHKMAEECGVRIAQLTPAHSQALRSYLQQRYTLKLTGKQENLLEFLCQLETEYPSVRISQFNTAVAQSTQLSTAQLILEVFAGYSENST